MAFENDRDLRNWFDELDLAEFDAPSPLPAGGRQVGGDHYRDVPGYEPWDILEATLPPAWFAGFLHGNVQKYLRRYRNKNGIEDVAKMNHYGQKLEEFLRKNPHLLPLS